MPLFVCVVMIVWAFFLLTILFQLVCYVHVFPCIFTVVRIFLCETIQTFTLIVCVDGAKLWTTGIDSCGEKHSEMFLELRTVGLLGGVCHETAHACIVCIHSFTHVYRKCRCSCTHTCVYTCRHIGCWTDPSIRVYELIHHVVIHDQVTLVKYIVVNPHIIICKGSVCVATAAYHNACL